MPTTLFTFNRNYKGLDQVAEFIGDFAKIRQEIVDAGAYPYNDSFRDRIPGIANKEKQSPSLGSHEDAAIYLLQRLYRQREMDARVEDLLADGYEFIETLDDNTRFKSVVLYPDVTKMQGEWAEYPGARLVFADYSKAPAYVLPKGKRTHGHLINGRRVLVLR